MNGYLTILSKAVAFGDQTPNSNPQLKFYDWSKNPQALPVSNPQSFPGSLAAGMSKTIFDATEALTLDNSTAFSVTLSSLDAGSRYRFSWTGGTNPTLRTDRGLTLSGQAVTVVANANNSVNLTLGGGTFGSVVVGDIVYIPGVTTGDSAGPFNPDNEGFWTVLAVISTTDIQLARLPGESYSAAGETQTIASNAQLQAFSAAGVQVGDSVTISAGFSTVNQKTFVIDQITSTWFEVLSTSPLAVESGKMPGTAGIAFYSFSKRFIRIEATEEMVVQLNGDTGFSNRLSPIAPGDLNQVGWFEKFGPVFKLVLVNKASVSVDYAIFTCE